MDIVIFHIEQASLPDSTEPVYKLAAARFSSDVMTERFSIDLAETDTRVVDGIDVCTVLDMERVFPRFLSFLEGVRLACFTSNESMATLLDVCETLGYELPTSVDALDVSALAKILLPTQSDFQLHQVCSKLALPSEIPHEASAYVEATAAVLASLHGTACELPYVTLQQLTHLAAMYSPVTSDWFSEVAEQRQSAYGVALPDHVDSVHQLAFHAGEEPDAGATDEVHKSVADAGPDFLGHVSSLLGKGSPLKDLLPNFEVRPGQQQMVQAVAEALTGDQHLIVEAGTGTGKSLAYLIPSVLYAQENDTRVVVSTHTIALQDQIATRDFPILQQMLDRPVSLTVFKGRTHYVCMRKVYQEVRGANFATPRAELETYMRLLVWLTLTPTGNREELAVQGKLSEVWPRIQSETESCINKRCPFFKPCYYFRARSRAYDADVVVTNHSLVFSDLKADHRVLPKYDKLILDEAHHLEEQATKHLGDEVHWLQCLSLIGRVWRENGKHGVVPELLNRISGSDVKSVTAVPVLENMQDTLRALRTQVDQAFVILAEFVPRGQSDVRITTEFESTNTWKSYLSVTDKLSALLKDLEEQSTRLAEIAELEPDEELAGRLFDATGFLQEVFGHVHSLCSAGDLSDDWVVWIEAGNSLERRQVSLHRAPIDVAKILRATLFDSKSSVVLTSATLSVGGKFDYTKLRVGLDEADRDGRLLTASVPSPFRFSEQALLCVPTDVPELAKMDATQAAVWLSDSIYQLSKVSGGRLLALFTSHAMLRATAEAVREPLRKAGLELFAQGLDGSRTNILERFRHHPQAVLFGAQSFWEGIDLPGDQLTTLVIVRLPFAPPTHPVTQARHDRLNEQGLSPFSHASLPEAVVRFRQGFGRLIRTVHDRGVVVVYDKRIVTARYGREFTQSIERRMQPVVGPEQAVIDRVRTFLQQPT